MIARRRRIEPFCEEFCPSRNIWRVGDIDGLVSSNDATAPVGVPDGCESGTDDEFAAFYRSNYVWSLRLAWLLTHRSADCEDLVHDAFVRVRKHFEVTERPAAYLRTVLVNICAERYRRQQREDRRLRLVAARSEVVAGASDRELLELVAGLVYNQRAVIVLRYWADPPDEEIAAVLGLRPGSVRSLAHRALRQLRKDLDHAD